VAGRLVGVGPWRLGWVGGFVCWWDTGMRGYWALRLGKAIPTRSAAQGGLKDIYLCINFEAQGSLSDRLYICHIFIIETTCIVSWTLLLGSCRIFMYVCASLPLLIERKAFCTHEYVSV